MWAGPKAGPRSMMKTGWRPMMMGSSTPASAATLAEDARDLDALLDGRAAPASRLGVARGHRRGVAIARLGLVEDGAEPRGVDPRLDSGHVLGRQELGLG